MGKKVIKQFAEILKNEICDNRNRFRPDDNVEPWTCEKCRKKHDGECWCSNDYSVDDYLDMIDSVVENYEYFKLVQDVKNMDEFIFNDSSKKALLDAMGVVFYEDRNAFDKCDTSVWNVGKKSALKNNKEIAKKEKKFTNFETKLIFSDIVDIFRKIIECVPKAWPEDNYDYNNFYSYKMCKKYLKTAERYLDEYDEYNRFYDNNDACNTAGNDLLKDIIKDFNNFTGVSESAMCENMSFAEGDENSKEYCNYAGDGGLASIVANIFEKYRDNDYNRYIIDYNEEFDIEEEEC